MGEHYICGLIVIHSCGIHLHDKIKGENNGTSCPL